MKTAIPLIVFLVTLVALASSTDISCNPAQASDWLTSPSTYSHDPGSGVRLGQYQPIAAPSVPQPTNFRTSGYTHTRSTLQYGQSADNYHRVEKWGDPVRPYGQWRFPYRPYSTPYSNWGAPYAGLNLYSGLSPGYGYRSGLPGSGLPRSGLPPTGVIGRPTVPGDPTRGAAPIFSDPLNPYPAGGNSPYPVAPYYDGYHPVYRE